MRLLDNDIGNARALFLIAGPCVVETRDLTPQIAVTLEETTSCLEAAHAQLSARGMLGGGTVS